MTWFDSMHCQILKNKTKSHAYCVDPITISIILDELFHCIPSYLVHLCRQHIYLYQIIYFKSQSNLFLCFDIFMSWIMHTWIAALQLLQSAVNFKKVLKSILKALFQLHIKKLNLKGLNRLKARPCEARGPVWLKPR